MELNTEFSTIFDQLKTTTDPEQRASLIHSLRVLKPNDRYTLDCTGDVVYGDHIIFIKQIWESKVVNHWGKKRNMVVGYELVEARVVNESYGDKGQHTFTLRLSDDTKMMIKGRNLYAVAVWGKPLGWVFKEKQDRLAAQKDKHLRGKNNRNKVRSSLGL